MKKQLLTLTLCFLSSLMLGCSSNTSDGELSKQIVGTFYVCETSEESEEIDQDVYYDYSIEEYSTYNSDNSYKDYGSFIVHLSYDEGSFDIKYNFETTGTWQVKNSFLVEDFDLDNMVFEFASTTASGYVEEMAVQQYNEAFLSQLGPNLKSGLIELEQNPDKIISLNDRHLILKDSDGQETTYKRTK